jgi:predicted ATPase
MPELDSTEGERARAGTKARSPDLAADVFVGRDRELGELDAALTDAVAGRGGLFLLVGDPGIGKTRLAEEFCAHAQAAGALTLWGRCWEGGGAPAFWPWVQVVRSYLRQRDPAALRQELGPGASYIAQIVPELREAVPDLPAALSLEAEHLRFALFDSVSAFMQGAATREPLVVVLDDLHAADPPSLLLLQFMARELRGPRLLVLGCYRDTEAVLDPAAGALLAGLARTAAASRCGV